MASQPHPLRIGDTLNEAFQFGLKRWGTVLRLGWLPVAVSLILIGLYFAAILDIQLLMKAEEAGTVPAVDEIFRMPVAAMIGLGLVLYIAIALLYSGVIASVYRLAALGEEMPGFFHLRMDGPAWRVFWASMISGLISLAILVVGILISVAAFGEGFSSFMDGMRSFWGMVFEAAESGTEPTADSFDENTMQALAAMMRVFAIVTIPMIYFGIRLSPFVAGSAAENRLILFGAFNLTKGRFWSILGAYIVMGIALMIVSMGYEITMAILEVLMELGASGGVFALIMALVGVIYFVLTVIYYAFLYGVQLSFQAIVYRRLKTGA